MDKTKITQLRKDAGMTQEDLAEKAYLTVRTIQRAEAGEDVSMGSLNSIANALGVPVSALFEDISREGKEKEIMEYSQEQAIQLRRRSTEMLSMWLLLFAIDFTVMTFYSYAIGWQTHNVSAIMGMLWVPLLLIMIAVTFYLQRIVWMKHLDRKYPLSAGVNYRPRRRDQPINNGWEFLAHYWWIVFALGGFLSWLIPNIMENFR